VCVHAGMVFSVLCVGRWATCITFHAFFVFSVMPDNPPFWPSILTSCCRQHAAHLRRSHSHMRERGNFDERRHENEKCRVGMSLHWHLHRHSDNSAWTSIVICNHSCVPTVCVIHLHWNSECIEETFGPDLCTCMKIGSDSVQLHENMKTCEIAITEKPKKNMQLYAGVWPGCAQYTENHRRLHAPHTKVRHRWSILKHSRWTKCMLYADGFCGLGV